MEVAHENRVVNERDELEAERHLLFLDSFRPHAHAVCLVAGPRTQQRASRQSDEPECAVGGRWCWPAAWLLYPNIVASEACGLSLRR